MIGKIRDFMELVKFKHTIFSLPFIFISMIVSANGWFGFGNLILAILAAIFARNFAMGTNRYLDRDIDAKNKRTENRPSADGTITPKEQRRFIVINALGFILVALIVSKFAFFLSFPILLILGFYSYMKRVSELAHVVLGLSLGFAPMAGNILISNTIDIWAIELSLGVLFWVAGFDLLYSLQDMEFDKKEKLYSIPAIYGVKSTLFISKLFHMLTVVFWLLFAMNSHSHTFTYIAIFLSAIILYKEHDLVEKNLKNIPMAFFTLNGYLGIMFLIFVILDSVYMG